jgi:8-oxo-dGTP pyrophosphatase MutT (NUDIX family)
MARSPIPSWYFALVVVRLGNRFLLVQEVQNSHWYFPGGRVEVGETFREAAKRETLEESGIRVGLEGILRIEHTPMLSGTRLRVIFVATPLEDAPPKTTPDQHSLGAKWFLLSELKGLSLRGVEVWDICNAIANGALIYPLNLIEMEGTAFI